MSVFPRFAGGSFLVAGRRNCTRIDLVIEAEPQDVVGDPGIEPEQERRRIQRSATAVGSNAKIEVKVFDLPGPVTREMRSNAETGRPARLGPLADIKERCDGRRESKTVPTVPNSGER